MTEWPDLLPGEHEPGTPPLRVEVESLRGDELPPGWEALRPRERVNRQPFEHSYYDEHGRPVAKFMHPYRSVHELVTFAHGRWEALIAGARTREQRAKGTRASAQHRHQECEQIRSALAVIQKNKPKLSKAAAARIYLKTDDPGKVEALLRRIRRSH